MAVAANRRLARRRPAAAPGGRPIRDLIARLLPYLARYRRGLAWGAACIVLTNAITLAQPFVLRLAVDDLYHGVTAYKLGRYALILFGIALAGGVFKYFMRLQVIGISRHIEYDLRNDVFAHLQTLPAQYYQATPTGDLMSRATNDLSAVRMMVGPGIMYLVNTVVVAAISIGCMVAISPRLTLYSLLPLPFVSLTAWIFGERIHRRFERIQAQFAELSTRVQENLSGVRVIRAFAREHEEVETFHALNVEYLARSERLIRVWGIFYPLLAFLSGLAALLALYLGGREVVHGHISLGQFVAFTVYLAMLNWPVVALGWVINLFQRGMASFRRLAEILDVVPAIANPLEPRRRAPSPAPRVAPATNGAPVNGEAMNGTPAVRGEIEFRDLTFTYPTGSRPALRGITLRIAPGQSVALVGRTGAGKSTLLALLPRLFDPPPGTVFIDGVDVREMDLADLRSALAVVPQETFLFSATVAENIAYGRPDAAPEAIARAAAVAHFDGDVNVFPEGYATLVGERGITLSGGQRQRAAIARALLRDTPILVLDDCLSSVDTHTEDAILRGLRDEIRRRTTLLVSHRVSTVREADLIVVIDDGRIVERGSHASLLALDGRYAELHRQQRLEEELEAS
jgi:ATP-binding cassette, subfamily B, multidrug efflux pump